MNDLGAVADGRHIKWNVPDATTSSSCDDSCADAFYVCALQSYVAYVFYRLAYYNIY